MFSDLDRSIQNCRESNGERKIKKSVRCVFFKIPILFYVRHLTEKDLINFLLVEIKLCCVVRKIRRTFINIYFCCVTNELLEGDYFLLTYD